MKDGFGAFNDLGREYETCDYDSPCVGAEKPKKVTRTSYPSIHLSGDQVFDDSGEMEECLALVKLKKTSITKRDNDDGDEEVSCSYDILAIAVKEKEDEPDYMRSQHGGFREALEIVIKEKNKGG